ncbi:aminodeoxychorismate synthase component I [Donghicola mangrovi]|uniref:Aminodeoxychorismate synthase component I n=1 Tax=Donghicola mangrovi TaxID=2729614 RepID=A0A850Q5B9_9RHOB|nr:aminodeoxychorismate synthase component I [Donghicola mangrovi]NVO24143.1 aminodeoxychorismate synthase component I [Donghicola mangrovi]
MQIRFDHGPAGEGTCFDAPASVIEAWSADQVTAALAAVDAARAEGAWVAGYATYELGYALEPRLAALMPTGRPLPLMRFGVYEAPVARGLARGDAGLTDVAPVWDAGAYAAAFGRLHDYIGAGDIYQVNLTFPMTARCSGTPEALYAALADVQPVKHGALVVQGDLPALLSRSPELFFRTSADGVIETRPMKGTQPRSDDATEDARRKAWLAQDDKNRAENLMIVDLLRNDVSRVSVAGSVKVPELFHVESYATVHQMTSLVRAQLRDGVGFADIMTALFPCGSITGAPKVRAMEIIHELEHGPRDIYCGSIGWMAPDGRSEFNVAIRTLLVDGADVTLNVGGGVVWDSTADSEYEEALWKARYARLPIPASV